MGKKAWPFMLQGTVDPTPEGTDNPGMRIEPCGDDQTCTVIELDGFETLRRHVRHTELLEMMAALERRKREILG